jgi:hypothetical protein
MKPGVGLNHRVLQQILRVAMVARQPQSMAVQRLPKWNDIAFKPFAHTSVVGVSGCIADRLQTGWAHGGSGHVDAALLAASR